MGRPHVTEKLVLCGETSPFDGGEPCPLEHGHEGGHIYWTQTRPNAKRGRNGVWVVDEHGATILHATFEGSVTAEELCALLAIRDVALQRPA